MPIHEGSSTTCSTTDDRQDLREKLAGLRSCPVARFRIICRVAWRVIEVVAVGPRQTIYQETLRKVRRSPRFL